MAEQGGIIAVSQKKKKRTAALAGQQSLTLLLKQGTKSTLGENSEGRRRFVSFSLIPFWPSHYVLNVRAACVGHTHNYILRWMLGSWPVGLVAVYDCICEREIKHLLCAHLSPCSKPI
jgi:hypothetical protein